jgi:hypothetical protein
LPADFLLPLFVVTLLANAVLVAFAIRGMRRGQSDGAGPLGTGRPPTTTRDSGHVSGTPSSQTATEPAVQTGNQPEPAGPATSAAPVKSARKPAPVSSPKRRRTTKNAADAPAKPSGSPETRRGRRRFSLPPLDEDHERVSRSIESFLGGPDAAGPGDVDAATPDTLTTEAMTGPTTVAVIAVVDLTTGIGAPAAGDDPDDAVAEALAMVERTLRGAARGTDLVTVSERGRFRIVLPATGELAARSYLRRIRAAIEPRLEAAERTLNLAVATATALDEPLDRAVLRAEDRLSLALHAARESDRDARKAALDHEADGDPDDAEDAPRAAAD